MSNHVTFLHLADLHPNNSQTFAGQLLLDPQTGRNQALEDLRKSLAFVVSMALTRKAIDPRGFDACLISGDLFDVPRPHPNEIAMIKDFLFQITDHCPVIVIPGNHDLSQSPSDASALASIVGMRDIRILDRPEQHWLSFYGMDICISGLPYPIPKRLLTDETYQHLGSEELTAAVNHHLAQIVRGMQAIQPKPDFHLLLAHGTTSNAMVGEQPRSISHDILLPLNEMQSFDYVALGHIHRAQQVSPNAWYSGSLMRQSFNEEHEPKGFNVVRLEKGQLPDVSFIENPFARPYRTIDCGDQFTELLGAVDLPNTLVLRIKDSIHPQHLAFFQDSIKVLRDKIPLLQVDLTVQEEDRARDSEMADIPGVEDAVKRTLNKQGLDEQTITRILRLHHELSQEVPE